MTSNNDLQQARETVMRLLARREHSARELRQKLQQRGYDSDVINETLAKAQELGWQSDRRFAESWIRQSVAKGNGFRKISAQAQQKGIDDDLLQSVLNEQQPDWDEECYQRLLRKFGETPPTEQKQRDKMMRHLLQRGFSFDSIKRALQRQAEAALD